MCVLEINNHRKYKKGNCSHFSLKVFNYFYIENEKRRRKSYLFQAMTQNVIRDIKSK